jgi:hypothetical protein
MGERRETIGRRELIRRSVAVGGAIVAGGALLAGCGDDSGGSGGALVCSDVNGLTEAGKTTRTAMQYSDATADPAKTCDTCQLFQPGQAGACGTCTVVKGPIHPKGSCTAWVAKPA